MRYEPVESAFSLNFFGRFAESQCLGLSKYIRHKNVVMPAQWRECADECDEVTRDEPRALVDQLVKGVLAVGAWFAPVNGTRLVIHFLPLERDVFAVALHRQLLEIGRESFQV